MRANTRLAQRTVEGRANPAACCRDRKVAPSAPMASLRVLGNRKVASLYAAGVGPNLAVNRPGDRWEREADRAAQRIDTGGKAFATPSVADDIERSCGQFLGQVQSQPATAGAGAKAVTGDRGALNAPASTARVGGLASAGEPLANTTRSLFENRFGRDFGAVRIYRDAAAGELASYIGARAFTYGRDIAFAPGEYSPETSAGRRLLAHELTHVVQQATAQISGSASPPPAIQRFTAAECTASGCAPSTRCDTVQSDFERAEEYVEASVSALDASPLATLTQRAIRWYFHREADAPGGDIRRRLDLIHTMLLVTDALADFICSTSATCDDAIAYVNTSTPVDTPDISTIKLCNSYFDKSSRGRAETLIHEASHLIGMSVSTDDVYDHTFRFRGLSTDQAILNADSYALFASAIGTGSIGLSVLFSGGVGGGVLAGGPEGAGWAASFFIDTTFQHPVLHIFNPTLRLSATLAGVPGSGARPSLDRAAFVGVLPGFRLADPRPSGGTPSFSFFGGPSFNFRGSESAVGVQVGAAVGYQWSFLDVSAGVTYVRDPTALSAGRNLVQLGGTLSLIFPAVNP
jgi:hypothetical protein